EVGYVADPALATTVFLASRLAKPILAEGPAGVGKTALATALARAGGARLLRLQCYEGLDEARTLYEWKYGKQLLYVQLLRDAVGRELAGAASLADAVTRLGAADDAFFSEAFLEPRPLLEAVRATDPVVLLIDEVDRAEDELEAFFLEVLAEYQVTVPELGTFVAARPPTVVLTSNATRELSDALRRRCLFLPMGYPDAAREAAIVHHHVPDVAARLAGQLVGFVAGLRRLDLRKQPSIAETLDWARALVVLGADDLGEAVVHDTLTLLVKYEGDLEVARAAVPSLLAAR
ncbi:MAG: MoxR family ATPase, partial [Myxococcales bacterium]|nr:MoxR family ATPase [Myxococcales bacterium]